MKVNKVEVHSDSLANSWVPVYVFTNFYFLREINDDLTTSTWGGVDVRRFASIWRRGGGEKSGGKLQLLLLQLQTPPAGAASLPGSSEGHRGLTWTGGEDAPCEVLIQLDGLQHRPRTPSYTTFRYILRFWQRHRSALPRESNFRKFEINSAGRRVAAAAHLCSKRCK